MGEVTRIYSRKAPRALTFFKNVMTFPESLNASTYYDPYAGFESGQVESDANEDNDHEIVSFIYEMDIIESGEAQEVYNAASCVRFYPSNSVLLIPKIKGIDKSSVSLHNMMLICDEIFTESFGQQYHDSLFYYIVQEERLTIVVTYDFAKTVYYNDYTLRFSMNDTRKFYLRAQITECSSKTCYNTYHSSHSPDNPVISPFCIRFKKHAYNSITAGTAELFEESSNTTRVQVSYALQFHEATFDLLKVSKDHKTFSHESDIKIVYQETPITIPRTPASNLSELISSSNIENSVSSICINFNSKVEDVFDFTVSCDNYVTQQMMINVGAPKSDYYYYSGHIRSIIVTDIINFYWTKQSKLYFMVGKGNIILFVHLPSSWKANITTANKMTTLVIDEKIELQIVKTSLHSVKNKSLFLKGF